jgi:hypothetical protein
MPGNSTGARGGRMTEGLKIADFVFGKVSLPDEKVPLLKIRVRLLCTGLRDHQFV